MSRGQASPVSGSGLGQRPGVARIVPLRDGEDISRVLTPLTGQGYGAFGKGLAYSLVLPLVGGMRKLYRRAARFGGPVLPVAGAGGHGSPVWRGAECAFGLPSGGLLWVLRAPEPEQTEATDHTPPQTRRVE